jgi:hypothetical protein
MNQHDFVLATLKQNKAVCGTFFLDEHIPRYAARVGELRAQGHNIVTRSCEHPWHSHNTRQIEYVLLDEGRLF